VDVSLLTAEVVGAYDFWISCILAASGGGFYYIPERLTNYRIHDRMETGRRTPEKSRPLVYIFEQLLAKNWFPTMRRLLVGKLAGAYFQCGRDLLWFNQTETARTMFCKALKTDAQLKFLVAYMLSLAPYMIRRQIRLTGGKMGYQNNI